jgi:hypothetical protein
VQWQDTVTRGARTGLKVIWELAKVIIPAVVIVHLLERTGMMPQLSRALGPVMSVFGLPGEGALVLVTANFVSFYGGLAALVALDLTWKQVTILAAMMMICHGAITETALVAKAGARAGWVLATRVAAMTVVGLLLNWLLP